ncbi:hypothetical protein [Ramlibacter albus]|uniref:Uncharacterized protein n=1 Tax=Ramlibacter albus TaxID=2079448 RepID=A0A923MER8_9BURK|nr:hypothetical protein [Ramlibacter albus]MBC5767939.1 hypothetical protein [Ramlibacter albus]
MSTTFTPFAFGTNDVQVMAGSFDECAFDDVVQVLGMSRQCLRFRVNRADTVHSEVLLKAGQVLDARMPGSEDPKQVFNALGQAAVPGSGLSFSVYHTQPNGAFPTPKASLLDLHAQTSKPAAANARPSSEDRTVQLDGRPALSMPSGSMPAMPSAAMRPAPVADATLRRDVGALLELVQQQVEAQVQAQARLEGRLQALPQLIAAEVRAAIVQAMAQAVPAPAPAPAPRERSDSSSKPLLATAVAMLAVLTVAAVVVAAKMLR